MNLIRTALCALALGALVTAFVGCTRKQNEQAPTPPVTAAPSTPATAPEPAAVPATTPATTAPAEKVPPADAMIPVETTFEGGKRPLDTLTPEETQGMNNARMKGPQGAGGGASVPPPEPVMPGK